jgi:general secretion pathway protein A
VTATYETFFGLTERPFSLTPDPRFFFNSSSHGRVLETLSFGLERRERVLLVTGDLGIGKTVLCRALVQQLRNGGPVSFVSNPLLTPSELLRLLIEDFHAQTTTAAKGLPTSTPFESQRLLVDYLRSLRAGRDTAVVVIDEAHRLPAVLVEPLLSLASPDAEHERALQLVLVGQATPTDATRLGITALDDRTATRTRLTALGRDECAEYVAYRLRVAGATQSTLFTPRAIDVLHGLSGGIPRLVNLLCERALQEAETHGSLRIEPSMIAAAASALELLLARPRRFRWFSRRVS